MNYISKVIDLEGLVPTAAACGVSYQSVRKWEKRSRLPRTEFTNETEYARKMAELTRNKVTKKQLLSMTGPD